jgi:hypothetical protein
MTSCMITSADRLSSTLSLDQGEEHARKASYRRANNCHCTQIVRLQQPLRRVGCGTAVIAVNRHMREQITGRNIFRTHIKFLKYFNVSNYNSCNLQKENIT